MNSDCDFLIVGAGIAGASLAARLAPHARVIMIEAEDMPGYHATGRSAAFWHESYGGPGVQPLSRASFAALAAPEADFSDHPFLKPRAALTLARDGEQSELDAFIAGFGGLGVDMKRLDQAAARAIIPGLRAPWRDAVLEPACSDIDVGALHQAYLRAAQRQGAQLICRAALQSARRGAGGLWTVTAGTAQWRTPVLINAAGAWADRVAERCGIAPLAIRPFRRTVVQVRLAQPIPADLPLCIHVGGEFYFKGEGLGRIWLSPHDETPDEAGDVAAEEWDVALAIDRLQQVVDWDVAAVERKWAGLRSFAPDRLPVFGPDPDEAAFVWCAGQGGFGIQTAPAAARLLGDSLLWRALDGDIAALGDGRYGPARLR